MGGIRWIGKDFGGADIEPDEVRSDMKERQRVLLRMWKTRPSTWSRQFRVHASTSPKVESAEKDLEALPADPSILEKCGPSTSEAAPSDGKRRVSFYPDIDDSTAVPTENVRSTACTPLPSRAPSPGPSHIAPSATTLRSPQRSWRRRIMDGFITPLFHPVSTAILISFPIALIPDVKALFVPDVPGTHIPNAPDGQPPLAFILDATSFMGAASVPLGLICLGAAFARLKVPRNGVGLPRGAIMSLAVSKTLIMPVVGVLICQGLTHIGFIDPNDKVLRFVCM